MRHLLTLSLFPLLLFCLPACGDNGPAGPDPGTERYALVEVGGASLPAVIFDEDIPLEEGSFRLKVTVNEGWMELDEDGAYRHEVKRTATVDGQPTPNNDWKDHGRYETTATGLRFTSDRIASVVHDAEHEAGEIRFLQDLSGEGRPIMAVYRK